MRAILLLVALVACDETARGVRHDYVTRHRDAFVYEMPRGEVLDDLKTLLAENGFELVENHGDVLHTKRRDREEVAVHLLELKKRRGFMVQLVRITRDERGEVLTSARDPELEWDLIQRADPDAAYEIMSKANARADRVAPRAKQSP